ncbi:polycystin-1-like protein 2 [Branchiostoma floridae x Branchiostoma belcheri]
MAGRPRFTGGCRVVLCLCLLHIQLLGASTSAMPSSTGSSPSAMSSTTGSLSSAMPSSTESSAMLSSTGSSAMSSSTGSSSSAMPSSTGSSAMSSSTGSSSSAMPSSTGSSASAMPSSTGSSSSAMPSSTGSTPSATPSSTSAMSSSTGSTPSFTPSSTSALPSSMESKSSASAMPSSTGSSALAMPSSTGSTPSATPSSTSAMSSSTGSTPSFTPSSTSAMPSSTGSTQSALPSSMESKSSASAMPSSTGSSALAISYFPYLYPDICEADNDTTGSYDNDTTGSHSFSCILELIRQVGCRASVGSALVGDVMTGNSSLWSLADLRSYFSGVRARADAGDSMSAYACYLEGCDDGWFYRPASVTNTSSCYLPVTNLSSYRNASRFCRAHGANLTAINTVTEGDFLLTLLKRQNITVTVNWYVGLRHDGARNETLWENGDSLNDDVSTWLQDGLLNVASNQSWCLQLCGSCLRRESAWTGVPCEEVGGSVCEKPARSDVDGFPACARPLLRCPEDGRCLTRLNLCDSVSDCETLADESNCSICQQGDFGICRDVLDYNVTSFPNAFGHRSITEVFSNTSGEFFAKILNISSHETLPKFVCSTLFPECQAGGIRVLPCKDLCKEAKSSFKSEIRNLGLSWPEVWDCSLFPKFRKSQNCFRGYDAGCSSPSLVLIGAAPSFQCTDINRADRLQLSSKLTLDNCSQNVEVRYNWTINYLLSSGEMEAVPLPSDVRLNLYDVFVPAGVLDYGILGIKLNATICGDSAEICDVFIGDTDALGCFMVVDSPLVARLAGGSSRSVPSGSDVTLDASGSHDPDANVTSEELTYDWNCELAPAGSDCGLPAGTLDLKTSVLNVSAADLVQGQVYSFSVLVSFSGRLSSDRVTQKLTILQPEVPTVQISCKSNCDVRVNPSERLVLEAGCTNCVAGDRLTYAWSLSPGGPTETVQRLDWARTTTGSTTRSLGIKSGTFQGAETYVARVEVSRAGVTGFAEFAFTTNTPPAAGTCEISPPRGTELTDLFSIKCTGFEDPDTPLTYEFSYQTGGENVASFSTTGQDNFVILGRSPEPELEEQPLPAGLESRNYAVTVRVTARDALGAETEAMLSVTVRPIPENDFSATVSRLIGDQSRISESASTGDTQAVVSIASSVGTALNAQSGTGSGSKRDREMLREALLTRWISDATDTVRTLDTVEQLASTISVVTATKDELSTTSQLGGAASLSRLAVTLVERAGDGAGTDAVENAAKTIITGLVNIMQASSLTSLEARDDGNDTSKSSVLTQTGAASTSVFSTLRSCTTVVFSKMTTGQEPVVINADGYNMALHKQECSGLGGLVIRTSTESDNWFKLPDTVTADLYGNSSNCGDVDTEMSGTNINPYEFAESSAGVSSDVLSLSLLDVLGERNVSGLSQPIDIMISRGASSVQSERAATAPVGSGRLSVHNVTSTFSGMSGNSSIFIHIEPLVTGFPIHLYLKNGVNVSNDDHDLNASLPVSAALRYSVELPDRTESSDDHTWLIQPDDLLRFNESEWYLGVAHEVPSGTGTITDSEGQNVQPSDFSLNYTITIFSSTCLYFADDENVWKGDGCQTGRLTTPSRTHCLCNHLTPFASGSSFFVAPNSIDIVASILAFSDIASNPAVVITMAVIVVLYILVVIWARRKDKKDMEKVGVTVLPGVTGYRYRYIVTLYTGFKRFAGTTAKVAIIVTGEDGQSEPHLLTDPERRVFEAAGVDSFLITTAQSMGPLSSVHVWHDNSGDKPSWFLDQISVYDLQEEQKYVFMCNRWLAEDDDDGLTERHLPVASERDLKDFFYVFSNRMAKDFRDGHLWFSVAGRPVRSMFTRVQRVSCCLSLLLCTMVVNIAFFGVADAAAQNTEEKFDVAGFTFTWTELMISVQSALIVLPINLVIVQIFRNLKVRPGQDGRESPLRHSAGKRRPGGAVDTVKMDPVCEPNTVTDEAQTAMSTYSSRFMVSEVDIGSVYGEEEMETLHEHADEQVLHPHTPEPTPVQTTTPPGQQSNVRMADDVVIRCKSLPSLKIRVRSAKARSYTQTENYADNIRQAAQLMEEPVGITDAQTSKEPRFRQIIQQNKSLLKSEMIAEKTRLVDHLVARNTLTKLEKEAIQTLSQKETEDKVNNFLLTRIERQDEGAFSNFCAALTHGARQGYLSELLKAGDREDLPALLDYLYAAALHIAGRPTADIMWRVFPRHLGLSDEAIETCHRQNRFLQHKVLHCLLMWYINQGKRRTPLEVIHLLNSVHEKTKCSCKSAWIWKLNAKGEIPESTLVDEVSQPHQETSGIEEYENTTTSRGKDTQDATSSISFGTLELDMPPRPYSAGEIRTPARLSMGDSGQPVTRLAMGNSGQPGLLISSANKSRSPATLDLSQLPSSDKVYQRETSLSSEYREDTSDGFFEIQFSEPGSGMDAEAGNDVMQNSKTVEFRNILKSADGDTTSSVITSTEKKSEPFLLPWWFLFVGWSLVLVVCLVSAFFTLLYGNSYGKNKAEAWLLTFFTSFLLDVVILQPVKVLVVAVVLAVIVKSVDTGDDDAVTAKLGQDEEFLHIASAEEANIERPTPPVTDPQKLAAARQLRAKQRQMYSVMVEVIFYLLFVWVTVSIANGHRSESAFYQNTDIKETFLAPVTEDDGFLDIGNLDDFWGWLEDGLLPGLTEEWYNGFTVDNSAFTAGLVHYLVGVTRLRQIRVRSDALCTISPSVVSILDDCNVEYSWDNEDTRPINNRAVNQTTSPWVYQTSAALNGYPFWGTFALYSGGGYVAELGTNSRESSAIIQNLKDNAWLDDNTRAVLVEFTMYNAYVNLFSVVTLALELPVSGGVFPRADIQTVRLYNYTSQYTLYILACEILYIFMLVFYLYREVKELRQKKCQYFSEFWNWVEVLVALLSLCAVGLFACRMVITDRVTAYRRSNPGRFVNYSEAAFWDAVYGYVIAVIVTLVIAKFVKLLRFNRRMSLIGDTIKHAAPKVLGFVVIYIVVIMAFAQALFLVLGNTSESFGTFLSCLETLWNIQLGEFEFSDFWDGHWLLGPTLWFCYVVTSNCILVFTFVAIMMDSFERVNANIGKQSNDHEIVDFMVKQFKDYIGWKKEKNKNSNIISPGPGPEKADDLTEDGKQPKLTKSRESWVDVNSQGKAEEEEEETFVENEDEKNMKDPFYCIL